MGCSPRDLRHLFLRRSHERACIDAHAFTRCSFNAHAFSFPPQFALILAFLYSIQVEPNAIIPGCGITNTVYQGAGTGKALSTTDEANAPVYATLFLPSNLFYDAFSSRYPDSTGLPDLNCVAGSSACLCPSYPAETAAAGLG